MNRTLYLLRKQPNDISSAIFQSDDADIDIVLIEQARETLSPSEIGIVVGTKDAGRMLSGSTMSYAEAVEKIFSVDHIIVV